jgi:hypothetical protein
MRRGLIVGDDMHWAGSKPGGIAQQLRSKRDLQSAITQGLGDVGARHRFAGFEVGERAGDSQHPMVSAGRELKRLDGFFQEGQPVGVGPGDRFQKFSVGFGVGADRVAGVARALNVACGGDPGGNLGRTLGGRRQGEIVGADGADFDVKIDAVDQRAGQFRLIVGSTFGCAGAGAFWIGKIAAAAAPSCYTPEAPDRPQGPQTQGVSGAPDHPCRASVKAQEGIGVASVRGRRASTHWSRDVYHVGETWSVT